MMGVEEEWQRIEKVYEAVIRSARELDRIANLKVDPGLELDGVTIDFSTEPTVTLSGPAS